MPKPTDVSNANLTHRKERNVDFSVKVGKACYFGRFTFLKADAHDLDYS